MDPSLAAELRRRVDSQMLSALKALAVEKLDRHVVNIKGMNLPPHEHETIAATLSHRLDNRPTSIVSLRIYSPDDKATLASPFQRLSAAETKPSR